MTPPDATCPWWKRWSHRNARRRDNEVLYEITRTTALCYVGFLSSSVKVDPFHETVNRQWADFKQDKPHWNCPCAKGLR